MTTPAPANDRVIFPQVLEAFYLRALKGSVTPELTLALRALGIDLEKPFLPAYPFDLWVRSLELTATLLRPRATRAQAFMEFGQRLITSYQETLMGKALFTALRIFSARRVIDRMSRNFRTSNNFTEVKVTDVGPTTVDLTFNVVESDPSFTQGVLSAGFAPAGLRTAAVTLLHFDGVSATYRVNW